MDEAAEAELIRRLDLPDYFPTAPRVQQVINYRSKLWLGQRVTATVKIQAVGRTSLTMAFEVCGYALEPAVEGPDEGSVAAYGTVTTVHVPVGATTSQPWPEHFPKLLDPQTAP